MKQKYLLAMLMFSYYAASAVLFPLFPLYLSRRFSPSEIGILMALIPVSMIFLQPFWGKAADRFGIRRVLLLTLVFTAMATVGLFFAKTFTGFFAVLAIYSVFSVAINPLVDTLALSIDSKKYGSYRLWGSVGYGTAVFLNGTFKSYTLGFWTFVMHICVLLITLAIVAKIPCRQPRSKAAKTDDLTDTGSFALFKNPRFVILLVSSLLIGMSCKAYETFFPVGLSRLHASDLVLGSSWVVEIIPEIFLFYLLDKLAARMSAAKIMAAGIIMFAVRAIIIGRFPVLWVWIATQPMSSFAFCFWYYGAMKILNKMLDERQKSGGITVFWASTYGVGGVAGSLLSGIIVDNYSVPVLFVAVAGCSLLSFVFYVLSQMKKAGNPTRGVSDLII